MKTSPVEVIHRIETCVKKGNLERALNTLHLYFKENADQQSADEVLILMRNLADLKRAKHLIGQSVQIEENRITEAILNFRNRIVPEDERPAYPPTPIYKKAKLLHDIPVKMKVAESIRCIVRLAPDRTSLLKDFKPSPYAKIENIDQIGHIARVTLKPLNKGDFHVQTTGKPQQHIFPNIYTEWKFFVTPLREGHHTLNLITTLTRQDNTEIATWQVVFDEMIEVSSAVETRKTDWRVVADFESSPIGMAQMPWWMSLSLAFSALMHALAGTGAVAVGLGLGTLIGLLIPFPQGESSVKAFVNPRTRFVNPAVTYQGNLIRYEKNETNDILTVYLPEDEDRINKVLLVTDQGRTFKGYVDGDSRIIELRPLSSPPPPPPRRPDKDAPRTYLQIASMEDSLEVTVDGRSAYIARKTGDLFYAIPYNDTRRKHRFTTYLDATTVCEKNVMLRKNQDTIQLNCKPRMSDIGETTVVMSLPLHTEASRVSINGKAIARFDLNSNGTYDYVLFKVPRNEKRISVQVKDNYCRYEAGGVPTSAQLVLAGVMTGCQQRRVELVLNKDLQKILDENGEDIVIEARTEKGERMDIMPVRSDESLYFDVPNANLNVLMMLRLAKGGRLKICNMKIYKGSQAILRPQCDCDDCLVRIKPL